MDKKIDLSDLLTPQEHYLIGGTPPMELIKTDSDFYKPFGLLTKSFTPEEIIEKRKELKTFSGFVLFTLLGDTGLALLLEDINPITLTTVRDPRVTDTSDNLLKPKIELTKSFYANYELSLRDLGEQFEGRLRGNLGSSGPEIR